MLRSIDVLGNRLRKTVRFLYLFVGGASSHYVANLTSFRSCPYERSASLGKTRDRRGRFRDSITLRVSAGPAQKLEKGIRLPIRTTEVGSRDDKLGHRR